MAGKISSDSGCLARSQRLFGKSSLTTSSVLIAGEQRNYITHHSLVIQVASGYHMRVSRLLKNDARMVQGTPPSRLSNVGPVSLRMESALSTPNDALRLARERKGWTQAQLAEQIGASAISVHRWECGATTPTHFYRQKLCDLFGASLEALGFAPMSAGASQAISQQELPETSPKAEGIRVLPEPLLPFVPAPPRRLIGRDELLRSLKDRLLAGEDSAIAALSGLPGVGKSALLSVLACDEAIQAAFPDGVFWAGLGPTPDIQALLSGWGVALGLNSAELAQITSIEKLARRLHAGIGSRRALFVIDDAWQIEHALALKIGGRYCAHVLTTRSKQIAFQFAQDDVLHVPELAPRAAFDLLVLHAPAWARHPAEELEHIVQLTGCLPLALVLIGRYLQSQAITDQERRLSSALASLQDGAKRLHLAVPYAPVEAPPALVSSNHLSLEAVIALSDEALDSKTRAVLRALAVFPPKSSSFSEEAALAVAMTSAESLDALVDAGLVESLGHRRYTLHATIADYAREKGHTTDVETPFARYFVHFAKSYQREYALLEQESPNILAALQIAGKRNLRDELVQGTMSFAPFLLARGLYATARVHLEQARAVAQEYGDHAGFAALSLFLAHVLLGQGHYKQAESIAESGLAHSDDQQIETKIAFLHVSGLLAEKQGNYQSADQYYRQGLALARTHRQHGQCCALLANLGTVAGRQGDYAQAEIYTREGLTLAEEINDQESLCALHMNLANIGIRHGDLDVAEAHFRASLAIAQARGLQESFCKGSSNLGLVLLRRGHIREAEEVLLSGLEIARQIGHPERVASLLKTLGGLALDHLGDRVRAKTYLEEGIQLARQLGHLWLLTTLLNGWGELHLQEQQFDEAQAALLEALRLGRAIGGKEQTAHALYELARLAASQNRLAEAYDYGQESLALFKTTGQIEQQKVAQWLATLSQRARLSQGKPEHSLFPPIDGPG
jgi:tetratricopeptide (TPR) repeat protein/transcriptional regulator with XRE-family HTH domain